MGSRAELEAPIRRQVAECVSTTGQTEVRAGEKRCGVVLGDVVSRAMGLDEVT